MWWLTHRLLLLLLISLPYQAQAGLLWEDNFNTTSINHKGATGTNSGITTDMSGISKWSINTNSTSLNNNDWFRVQNQRFEGRDLDGEASWESQDINLLGFVNITFQLEAIEDGDLEGNGFGINTDYFDLYYSVDGGITYTLIQNWNSYGDANHTLLGDYPNDDDWKTTTISQAIPNGSTSLKMKVIMRNSSSAEVIAFDNITVTGNALPIAVDDTGTTLEDTTLTVSTSNGLIQDNDTDSDGDPLIITQFTIAGISGIHNPAENVIIPNIGSLKINANGSYEFIPVANYHGTIPSATYTLSDGNGGTDTAKLFITVTSVNDFPTATSDIITGINEDSGANTIDVLIGDSFGGDGPNSGAITLPSATSAYGGSVTVDNNGSPNDPTDDKVIYTPALDFNGVDTFDYTITDSNGDTSTATVTLTINAVNDPPIPDNEVVSAIIGTIITIDALDGDTDPNGDTLTITEINGIAITNNGTAVILSDGTSVELANNQLVVSPANGVTFVNFNYTVDDGNAGIAQGQVSITLNAPPIQQAIPTLSAWALLFLILILGVTGYRQKLILQNKNKEV